MSYSIMLDAIHADAGNVPVSAPKVAGYVTGTPDIEWLPSDWARFPSSGHVRIDQSPALAAWASGAADVADVENFAGTQATAVAEALERHKKGWYSFVYVAQGSFDAMQSAMNAAGLEGHVQYWVANWDLDEAQAVAALSGDVVAVQYASPSSNPATVVPGGTQTLSEANLDISVTVPSWFQYITPEPQKTGVVITSGFKAYPVTSYDGITWLVTG
jgi:hypothetical protein